MHYHFYDAKDFIKKFNNFKKHPDTFLSGNKVGSLKILLRDIVNKSGMSNEQLKIYFKDNLMFNEDEVAVLLKNKVFWLIPRKENTLMKILLIKKIFSNL